jgi:hypothetical protein
VHFKEISKFCSAGLNLRVAYLDNRTEKLPFFRLANLLHSKWKPSHCEYSMYHTRHHESVLWWRWNYAFKRHVIHLTLWQQCSINNAYMVPWMILAGQLQILSLCWRFASAQVIFRSYLSQGTQANICQIDAQISLGQVGKNFANPACRQNCLCSRNNANVRLRSLLSNRCLKESLTYLGQSIW